MGTDRELTVDKAAAQANCHPETIRRAIRSGELPAHKDRLAAGSPWVVLQADLTSFVEARRS